MLGSEFQIVGPAEAKERQPKVLQRTCGWWLADRRCRRPAARRTHWNAVVGEVHRCLIPETPVDGHVRQACIALTEGCRAV